MDVDMDAREAVVRILRERYPLHSNGFNDETADDVLTRLRPIIAAEIRDYTKAAKVSWTIGKHTYALDEFARDADAIASRICGGSQ